jgi:hypothetical protein
VLGWHISILRPEVALDGPDDKRLAPPKGAHRYPDGTLSYPDWVGRLSTLAKWESSWHGLDFIDPLLKSRTAVWLWGNGYPNVYVALAGPLSGAEPTDFSYGSSEPDSQPDLPTALGVCDPDEWLLIIAWDLS